MTGRANSSGAASGHFPRAMDAKCSIWVLLDLKRLAKGMVMSIADEPETESFNH